MDNSKLDNSKHALSMLYRKRTAEELVGLQRIYRWVIVAWVPLAIAVVVMSSLWADIQGKKEAYSDASAHWQSCFTQADYQYISLNELIAPKIDTFKTCLGTLYNNGQGVCTFDCLYGIAVDCASSLNSVKNIQDPALPSGHMLQGFSYIGIQAVIFSAAAHASMRRALVHPSWLPSTIALMVWFIFAIFTYYTIAPILPVPGQTNSTFLTYIYYASDYTKYDNFNNGDNKCKTAYAYEWFYIMLIILLAVSVAAAGIIGVYAEKIRYKSLKKHYEPLGHTEIPVILASMAICFYVVFAVSKMASSITDLDAINRFDMNQQDAANAGYLIWFPQIYFPFAQPFFDLSTILGVMSFISILRGYTIQSISAFRLAFIAALVFAVSTYPGIVGAYEFYNYNDFSDYDSCKNFFLKSGKYEVYISSFYRFS
jgi:hypothetical protein